MNWKSIVSIIALLAIGFVGGFITHRYMTKQMAEKIADLRRAKGMENKLYEVLDLDATQKTQLAPIIEDHFKELAKLNQMHRESRSNTIKGLSDAVLPALNETQKERFEKFTKRLKRSGKRKQKNIRGKN